MTRKFWECFVFRHHRHYLKRGSRLRKLGFFIEVLPRTKPCIFWSWEMSMISDKITPTVRAFLHFNLIRNSAKRAFQSWHIRMPIWSYTRPVTSLGHQGVRREIFREAQIFETMSNNFKECPTHFSRGDKIFLGVFRPPGYGPVSRRQSTMILELAYTQWHNWRGNRGAKLRTAPWQAKCRL